MFKINKRNTFNYIISSILIFSIFTSNTAYAEIYFSEDSRQGIERLESIQDVDLDIYLDVGVHNELWQHIVEQLDLEEQTGFSSYIQEERSIKKMSKKFSRYIGKKIQKILAKYSNLESVKTVDEMAYAVAHFKLDLNRYVKTGKIESNFKILEMLGRKGNKELAEQFKEKTIFYYNNKNNKPYLNHMLCDYRDVETEKKEEEENLFPPDLVFAGFCIIIGSVLSYVPNIVVKGVGTTMATYGTVIWCDHGKDAYRDHARQKPRPAQE